MMPFACVKEIIRLLKKIVSLKMSPLSHLLHFKFRIFSQSINRGLTWINVYYKYLTA